MRPVPRCGLAWPYSQLRLNLGSGSPLLHRLFHLLQRWEWRNLVGAGMRKIWRIGVSQRQVENYDVESISFINLFKSAFCSGDVEHATVCEYRCQRTGG